LRKCPTHLLQGLLLRVLGALQKLEHVLGALQARRLDPQPVTELLDSRLEGLLAAPAGGPGTVAFLVGGLAILRQKNRSQRPGVNFMKKLGGLPQITAPFSQKKMIMTLFLGK
jgi:hypothetical protein